ncbi:PAS domain S-box [Thermoplasmatales archaeon SCGC AB-540-F20]|nr:PAS domain S-box [Thermoplasmatales archaeon SCGC AB-540-F20]
MLKNFFNMTENELFMTQISSLYPPEEWKKIRAENIRQKGCKFLTQCRMIRKNRGTSDVELSLCVLKGVEGKIVGSIGIIKDITKLKKSEKELIESEEKYKTIFENSAVAIMLANENGQIISWNNFTENLLGMTKEDLHLKPVESMYPAEEWQKIRSENIRQKGLQHHLETKMLKKNNEAIDVSLSVSVLKNHEGEIVGSIGIIEDNTESKQIKIRLEESEKKFKRLYENAPVPYHTLSPTGKVTDVNKKWCQRFGYTKEEVMEKSIFDFIDENEKESAKSSFEKKILNENSYSKANERTYITRNGEKRIFVIHDFFSFDKDKNIESVHTTMEDVTNRKKAERELREAHEKLKTLNMHLEEKVEERTSEVKKLLQQKDEFINQLGHDLKTPLNLLVNLLPILEKTENDPKAKKMFEILHRNTNRMKNIVVKTIDLARLNDPSNVIDMEDINLWEEAEDSIKDQQIICDEKDFTVENKIDENIFVKTDRIRLGEVFGNLINNAIKYNSYGGTITIDAHEGGDFVTVSIMDSGIGITREQIDRVFDEFYKADESRHDFDSSGLGLSICKRIVEKHGGRIWAESSGKGKGSTFYFTIPIGSKIDKKDASEKVKKI